MKVVSCQSRKTRLNQELLDHKKGTLDVLLAQIVQASQHR